MVVGVLAWLPQYYGSTDTALFAKALYIGIAAIGLNLLTGYNGQVSIGHGAFFGFGAYTTAILMNDHGWEFLATLPVVALASFAIGAAVGFPALRVKGLYLALITLGLAALFPDLVTQVRARDRRHHPRPAAAADHAVVGDGVRRPKTISGATT